MRFSFEAEAKLFTALKAVKEIRSLDEMFNGHLILSSPASEWPSEQFHGDI